MPAPGVPVYGPSGASAHVRGLAGGFAAQGHEVLVVASCLEDRRGHFGETVPALATGVPGWPSWLEGWRELREVWAARRLSRTVLEDAFRRGAPDLIVERHALWSDAGWRVHDRLGVPWVLEVNAPLAMERARFEELRLPTLAKTWERDVLRAAPVVVAVSDWLVRWLREEIGCANVHRVWNGVDARPGDRVRGRQILGVPEGEPVIGFVGSMKPWHGLAQCQRIAAATGARLALIGPAPTEIPANAIMTGHLGPVELAHVVAALDVGLVPYPTDAPPWFCPLKALDYRAQGTPVVGTDVGETRALVGEGGTVVTPGDEEALVVAVQTWMGRRRAPWVRSWRVVAEELLETLESKA